MKNKYISIVLILLVLIVVIVLVFDFNSTKIENRNINPYEFNVEEFEEIDPSIIQFSEHKQIKVDAEKLHAIAYSKGQIFILLDNMLKVIDSNSQLRQKKQFNDEPRELTISPKGKVIILFKNYFQLLNEDLEVRLKSGKENEKSLFTAVTCNDSLLFIADAGNRRVLTYDIDGSLKSEIFGKTRPDDQHGFIVPSAYFDLVIDPEGFLWVINPGKHQFQKYSTTGELLSFWEKTSMEIDGFSGCCNPAHFCMLPNGNFVTSEKGMIRIKIHDTTGNFVSVVAPPSKFPENIHALDVCADEQGNIYGLDYDLKLIRVFSPMDKK